MYELAEPARVLEHEGANRIRDHEDPPPAERVRLREDVLTGTGSPQQIVEDGPVVAPRVIRIDGESDEREFDSSPFALRNQEVGVSVEPSSASDRGLLPPVDRRVNSTRGKQELTAIQKGGRRHSCSGRWRVGG